MLVNLLGGGLLKRLEIISGKAVATFPFKGENIVLQDGPLHWTLGNNQLHNVGSLNGRKLNGLRITGAPEDASSCRARGVARTPVLPEAARTRSARRRRSKPIVLTAGSPKPDLGGAIAKRAPRR